MKLVSWIAALLAAATLLPAAETPTATGQDMKIKVAVFDFSTIDTVGQKFYRYTEEKIPPMTYNQLNASDYGTIDDRMLGLVRLFENRATLLERQEERDRMNRINDRTLAMRDALAEKILNSPQRTTVIGAEYMLVALGEYPRTFTPVDRRTLDDSLLAIELGTQAAAMAAAEQKFSRLSGATHVLYAVVSDCQLEENTFKGYGIETKNKTWTLDLLVKLVDLRDNSVAFSGLFTGKVRRLDHAAVTHTDTGLYEKLMKDAVRQAAAAMNRRFEPKEEK